MIEVTLRHRERLLVVSLAYWKATRTPKYVGTMYMQLTVTLTGVDEINKAWLLLENRGKESRRKQRNY